MSFKPAFRFFRNGFFSIVGLRCHRTLCRLSIGYAGEGRFQAETAKALVDALAEPLALGSALGKLLHTRP